MKRVLIVAVCMSIAFLSGRLLAGVSMDGTVITFHVAEGESETYAEKIPPTCTKVIKTGKGTLTVSADSADFHGDAEIREGVVVAAHMNALGRGSGASGLDDVNTISVCDGAQLRATFAPDKSDGNTEGRGFRSVVEVAGDGPDGTGAFFYDRSSNPFIAYWLLWELRLTADASIGGNIAYSARTFDLTGKTLTVKTPAYLYFYYCRVVNPGHIVAENNVKLEGSTLNGGATNTLSMGASSAMYYLSGANPLNWSVFWDATGRGSIEKCGAWDSGTKNVIKGDFTFNGTQLVVWPTLQSDGVTFEGDVVLNNGFLEKGGKGTVVLGGEYNTATRITMSGGTFIVQNSKTNIFGTIMVPGAMDIVFENAGEVTTTNGSIFLQGRLMQGQPPAKMEIAGDTDFRSIAGDTYFYVGNRQKYGSAYERTWGTLTIGEGVSMSNNFAVGNNGRGAVYQKGGDVFWSVPSIRYGGSLGAGQDGGYGYWGMDGGTLRIPRYVSFANDTPSNTAFMVLRGGTTTVSGEDMKLSTRGHAHLHVAGGKFTQTAGSTYMGYTDGVMGTGGDAVLTVEGEGCEFKAYWFVGMQNRKNFTSYVNINSSGVFEVARIVNSAGNGWQWPEGSRQYVSFNGGVWRTPKDIGLHAAFYSVSRAEPDLFLCQKGGAVFDTSNSSVLLNAPLVAPAGKVLKSITLPSDADFAAATNIGPARISITGSGAGATAYAPFDDDEGCLRGDVIITSPGSGYGEDTVVKVHSHDGDRSWDCAFELEDAVSGGLTKYGSGKLALKCVNTYMGKTSVKQGMLEMSVAGGIQDGTALEIAAGATLTLSNNLSVTTLEGAGSVSGGMDKALTVTEAFMLDESNLVSGATLAAEGSVVFGEGARIDVSVPDVLDSALKKTVIMTAGYIWGTPALSDAFGGRWRVSRNAAGTSLTLRYIRGTTLLIR